jgi:hypothetical protein
MRHLKLLYAGLLTALLAAPVLVSAQPYKKVDPTGVRPTFSANGTQTASAISLWRSAPRAGAFKLETNMAQPVVWKRAATMSGLWIGKVDCAGI